MVWCILYFCSFLLASGIGAPASQRSTSWTPNCSESELDVKWPDYDDSAKYSACVHLYKSITIQCPVNQLFSFIHQDCVPEDQYIPAPPKEFLPTESPPMNLPTPKTQSTIPTTASPTIITAEQESQNETTRKSTVKQTTVEKTTVEKNTTEQIIITTEKARPPTEYTGRATPPTKGPTAKPTTKGPTAKPPNTTTTKHAPPIGGITPPPDTAGYSTPPHINEPHITPPNN